MAENGKDDPFSEDPFAPATPDNDEVFSAPEEAKSIKGQVVSDGRRTPIPPAKPLPDWSDSTSQDRGDGTDGENPEGSIDYKDIETLNQDLLRLRVRQNNVRQAMRKATREAVVAKLVYSRAFRRALVQQTGGSAETRKATAELLCEELEADMVMKAQISEEYSTLFRSVRDDTENAKVVSYNLRALL